MPWLKKRWISFFIFSAVVVVALVSVTGWANNLEAKKKRNQLNSFGANANLDGTNWTAASLVLAVIANVNAFDPNSRTGPALALTLSYSGIVNQTQLMSSLPVPIQIFIQKTVNFSANQVFPQEPLSVNAPGNPNSYPFDSYEGIITIDASILPNGTDLPITMFVQGDVQGFTYTTQFQSIGDFSGSTVQITFDFRRSVTTQVFAIIAFVLMWFLSIGIFIASMTDFVRSNVNDLSLVGTATSLLFALPSVRNSQPGVPSPVGTTEDMVGFFWNMLLVAVSAIALLIKWIMDSLRPAPTVVRTDPENVERPLLGGKVYQ